MAKTLRTSILQFKAGKVAGYTSLYPWLAPTLFGVLDRILENESHSAQVLGEVFKKLWGSRERLPEHPGKFLLISLILARQHAFLHRFGKIHSHWLEAGWKLVESDWDPGDSKSWRFKVEKALEKLDDAGFLILKAAIFEEAPVHRLAQLLNISEQDVDMKLIDALEETRGSIFGD